MQTRMHQDTALSRLELDLGIHNELPQKIPCNFVSLKRKVSFLVKYQLFCKSCVINPQNSPKNSIENLKMDS